MSRKLRKRRTLTLLSAPLLAVPLVVGVTTPADAALLHGWGCTARAFPTGQFHGRVYADGTRRGSSVDITWRYVIFEPRPEGNKANVDLIDKDVNPDKLFGTEDDAIQDGTLHGLPPGNVTYRRPTRIGGGGGIVFTFIFDQGRGLDDPTCTVAIRSGSI